MSKGDKMKKNEFQNLKNFIELRLRECFDGFDRDFIKWSPDAFADIISKAIHREYQIKQKWDKAKYLVVPMNENHPNCHGCDNEFGDCGTPCTICDIADKTNKEWKVIFWVPDKFRVFERTSELS